MKLKEKNQNSREKLNLWGAVSPPVAPSGVTKKAWVRYNKLWFFQTYDDLERKYWKTLSFCPPIYGCDVSDSITDPDQESWNIRDLGTILNMVNEDYDKIVQGVNSPYLYFGMWKATFRYENNLNLEIQVFMTNLKRYPTLSYNGVGCSNMFWWNPSKIRLIYEPRTSFNYWKAWLWNAADKSWK